MPTAITKGRRNLAADALRNDADRHHQKGRRRRAAYALRHGADPHHQRHTQPRCRHPRHGADHHHQRQTQPRCRRPPSWCRPPSPKADTAIVQTPSVLVATITKGRRSLAADALRDRGDHLHQRQTQPRCGRRRSPRQPPSPRQARPDCKRHRPNGRQSARWASKTAETPVRGTT